MTDMATAQRLSEYRNELVAAGFTSEYAYELVTTVAPGLIEDLVLAADIEDQTPPIGEVRVHLRPQLDEADIERVAQEIQRRASAGTSLADR